MKLFFVDPATGDRINDIGSGSELSINALGTVLIVPDTKASVEESVTRVEYSFNDTVFTVSEEPFALTIGPDESADYKWQTGPLDIEVIAYNSAGTAVDSKQISVTVFASQTAADGTASGGESDGGAVSTSEEGQETLGSEFNFEAEAEAETESEIEVEAEAADNNATAAGAIGAAAAASGANALSYALASGSIATAADDTGELPEPYVPAGNASEFDSSPSNTNEIPQTTGDTTVTAAEAEVEAEAESEVETEAEAEVGNGSASAVAGSAISLAGVGSGIGGNGELYLSDVFASLDGASSTSVATVENLADNGAEENAARSGVTEVREGIERVAIAPRDAAAEAESEVEVEAEAEAEAEVGDGVAAAAASGGVGAAIVGNYAIGDTDTTAGTATSVSDFESIASLLNDILSTPIGGGGIIVPTSVTGSATVDGEVITTDTPSIAPDTGTPSADLNFESEAEAEAEAEAEVEAEVGNNSAAVAVVATGGSGAAGIGSDARAAASSAGSASTYGHTGLFLINNDLTQIAGELSDPDFERAAEVLEARGASALGEAEAEAEAEVESEAEASAPEIALGNSVAGAATTTDATGDSTAEAQVQLVSGSAPEQPTSGVVITDRIVENLNPDFEGPAAYRSEAGLEPVELEIEAEVEVEAEAEVGANAAAAGVAAIATLGHTYGSDTSLGAASSSATSTSVFDAPADDFTHAVESAPSGSADGRIFEVETEAEAEAEVGIGAGAAAAAAGGAGYAGIVTETAVGATPNAAAAAAAAGARVTTFVVLPTAGMAGSIQAYAAAWDDEGRGVSAAVALAGTPMIDGSENEFEIEAEGDFSVVLDYTIETDAFDPTLVPTFTQSPDAVQPETNEATTGGSSPEGSEAVNGSIGEAEVEAEAEAEAGIGVAAAAAGAGATGFAATTSSDATTSTDMPEIIMATAVSGDDGDNNIAGGADAEVLLAGAGNDVVSAGAGNDLVLGGAGDDSLSGGEGDDVLRGGEGSDQLIDSSGANLLAGEAGDDMLVHYSEGGVLTGGAGNDIMSGGVGRDVLQGGAGNDILVGDLSSTIGGNDVVIGGEGDDFMSGGLGADTFVFETGAGSDVIATLDIDFDTQTATAAGQDFDVDADIIRLVGFEFSNEADALAQFTDTAEGAVFSADGTDIQLFGVQVADLTADNIEFL